jgi:general secretion pathway protein C
LNFDLSAKRIRVLIVLITLALCAFFLAQGTTQLIAAKLLPKTPPATASESGGVLDAKDAPKGLHPPDFHAILARNIFDPQTGSLWPPKAQPEAPQGEGAEGGEAPPAVLAPGQMPPPCEGQAKLIASIYSERLPAWSFASLAVGGASPLLYRAGSPVDGKTIDSIYPESVFLKATNGALCALSLFVPPVVAGAKPPAAAATPATTEPASPSATPSFYGSSLSEAELDQGISQVSDTKYNVQRGLIDKVLANQSELMRSARVVPHEENGRVVGVKLYGIRRSSLLGKLGLQNGDMLRTINGFDMASPDAALEAYSKLRTASDLSVSVVRRGNPVTMEYGVK